MHACVTVFERMRAYVFKCVCVCTQHIGHVFTRTLACLRLREHMVLSFDTCAAPPRQTQIPFRQAL